MRQKVSPEKSREYQRRYHAKYPEKKAEFNRAWIANHRQQYNALKYNYRERLKIEVLMYYSEGDAKCKNCGETDIDVLCIDHINDDGAKQRKEMGVSSRGNNSGQRTYEAVKKAGFPQDLQVLCANCNMKKEMVRKRNKRLQNDFYARCHNSPVQV